MAEKKKPKAAKTAITKAQKRVLVARDVLKHLKSGRIKAGRFYFLASTGVPANTLPAEKLRDVLPRIAQCNVCGIGAAFYALVRRYDGLTVEDLRLNFSQWARQISPRDLRDKLAELFSAKQVAMIEAAYETHTDTLDAVRFKFDRDVRRAAQTYPHVHDRRTRMQRVFRNVIDHEGRFVPATVR